MTEALIESVPTIRFGRRLRTHGYRLRIEDRAVRLYTRCGKPTLGAEYSIANGVVTCPECQGAS